MKSKKHLKRRKISKQKTFQFERNGKRFKTKGLTAQSALNKLLRNRISIHESEVNIFNKKIFNLRKKISKLNTSILLTAKNATVFRVIINFIKRIFGIQTFAAIKKKQIAENEGVLSTERKEKIRLEYRRPFISEFKICF